MQPNGAPKLPALPRDVCQVAKKGTNFCAGWTTYTTGFRPSTIKLHKSWYAFQIEIESGTDRLAMLGNPFKRACSTIMCRRP